MDKKGAEIRPAEPRPANPPKPIREEHPPRAISRFEGAREPQRSGGHRYWAGLYVADEYEAARREVLGISLARREAPVIQLEDWDRYDNPFERKLTLKDKFHLPTALGRLMARLEHDCIRKAEQLFGVELHVDVSRHYAGVFIYQPGDHLSTHVDAGIHPTTRIRKHVTALLYLSGGEPLELWRGDLCTADDPRPRELVCTLLPHMGGLVFFENNDYAWHGVGTAKQQRIVLTVSYLSQQVDAFENRRQRAFFAPRPDEHWSEKTFALRDKRADPDRYREAYRA